MLVEELNISERIKYMLRQNGIRSVLSLSVCSDNALLKAGLTRDDMDSLTRALDALGVKRNPEPEIELSETEKLKPAHTRNNNAHHELCLLAAHWLHKVRKIFYKDPTCKWVVVEMVSSATCTPDVFGWGDGIGPGFAGVQIEVKMSHSDFLADKKKYTASNPGADPGYLKYYCCPQSVIKPDELPEEFGLLYDTGGKIEVIRSASYRTDKEPAQEVIIIASLMRRLNIKPGIYDSKKLNNHE